MFCNSYWQSTLLGALYSCKLKKKKKKNLNLLLLFVTNVDKLTFDFYVDYEEHILPTFNINSAK